EHMLQTLAAKGYVRLEPELPAPPRKEDGTTDQQAENAALKAYRAEYAHPTPELDKLLVFRSIHPLYGGYPLQPLGMANGEARIRAREGARERPRPILKFVRVPFPDRLPPGPLATTRLDEELIRRGLMVAKPPPDPDADEEVEDEFEERPPTLA